MYDVKRIARLFDERQPGYSLPQALYTDPEVFEFDLQAIFYRNWTQVGFEAELPHAGSYLATTIGRAPVVVVRDRRGDIHAFHNVCRHRGAQICKNGAGRVPRLMCPYHQWSYDLDGKLLAARGSDSDFDVATHGLRAVRLELVAGCIYVALSEDPPDFAPFRRVVEAALGPYNLRNLKVAHVAELPEAANWKLVMENGRECHHCEARHPELKNAFPVEAAEGEAFFKREAASPFTKRMEALGLMTTEQLGDWWQIGRYPLKSGYLSFSMDGKPLVAKPLSSTNDGNLGTMRWATEPSEFSHVSSDSVFTFRVNPVSPLTTVVIARWLVHKDAVEGQDYEVDRLIHMWNETNFQDRDLAENNQRGVSSIGYVPGPYSASFEPYVRRFVDWYCQQSKLVLGGGTGRAESVSRLRA